MAWGSGPTCSANSRVGCSTTGVRAQVSLNTASTGTYEGVQDDNCVAQLACLSEGELTLDVSDDRSSPVGRCRKNRAGFILRTTGTLGLHVLLAAISLGSVTATLPRPYFNTMPSIVVLAGHFTRFVNFLWF
ncbi:hypothetical protein CC86DRAFT_66059 [Ophiobolus disseminans]|uniref:Uncharacterized protein n=1 Tax=Ophiobolus disseminans TaxID=1469910 RepID=A0A6A6ZR69_9PLEO|nr:hypothetical protein CC86DRAFT_66059 [Ophiobolus disseminans]